VLNKNYDRAELLLNGGAKPDARDEWGRSPLHYAASSGSYNIAKLLIERGADVNALDADAQTPLHKAVDVSRSKEKMFDNYAVAILLLAHGANPNIQDKYYFRTPLHYAARNGAVDIVKEMLERGADPTIRDHKGKTPLDLAREEGHDEIVQILTSHIQQMHRKSRRRRAKPA
jgi:ankyrin repeat protein